MSRTRREEREIEREREKDRKREKLPLLLPSHSSPASPSLPRLCRLSSPSPAQVCALGEKGVPEATARQMLKALEAKSIDELASLCDGINPEAVDELRTLFQLAENYGFAVSRVCVCVCRQ